MAADSDVLVKCSADAEHFTYERYASDETATCLRFILLSHTAAIDVSPRSIAILVLDE